MNWASILDWEFVVSLLFPATAAVLLCQAETRGPLAKVLARTTGIVPPYIAAIVIIFGLFAARLTNDVWERENGARQVVQMEDDALRGLLHLANITDSRAAVLPAIQAYAKAAAAESPYSKAATTARQDTDKAFEALLVAVAGVRGLDPPLRSSFLSTATDLRRARDRRLTIADDQTAPIKWVSIAFLGVLAQISILLVHIGNRRALRASVGLFTVAFTFCLTLFALFDQPFETVLAKEPANTLSHLLEPEATGR
ncbi:MAG: DUF4239 domain-containing protein [Proteobacteria bacterium]|nr:DUF4239 domain-containing protein [Pseudomonadota bacterium]